MIESERDAPARRPGRVLITGASRGIGRATALAFAQHGWLVAAQYHRAEEQAQSLAASICGMGGTVALLQADLAVREDCLRLAQQAQQELGSIDVLVNNCGIAQQKLFGDITEEDWDTMFDVNVKSMFRLCHALTPGMIRRHAGKIINLSSMWGQVGASCEVHYSAAKAAVIGFTKALAKELGPSGITVNCVAPGVINTDMNSLLNEETRAALQEETPLMRLGTPEDVAGTILFLASHQADFITGQVICPNGGFII